MADSQPTAPNPFSATGDTPAAPPRACDELRMLVSDLGSAHDILEETVALMRESANAAEPIATWALIRLVEAVTDDVHQVYTRLDRLRA
jgi:hypothetical protein